MAITHFWRIVACHYRRCRVQAWHGRYITNTDSETVRTIKPTDDVLFVDNTAAAVDDYSYRLRRGQAQRCAVRHRAAGDDRALDWRTAPMQEFAPIAERIASLLKARGETLAVAESSTGGHLRCPCRGAARFRLPLAVPIPACRGVSCSASLTRRRRRPTGDRSLCRLMADCS
jgi:hypothetical protein